MKKLLIIAVIISLCAFLFIPCGVAAFADAEKYFVGIDCKHAEYSTTRRYYEAGEIVEIEIGKADSGYTVDHVLAQCDGEIIPVLVEGKIASFVMPDGDVDVTVTFIKDEEENKKGLSTKEIIAICVAGGLVLAAGGYFIFMKLKSKKKKN